MSVSYYNTPRLLFFVKEGASVNFNTFKEALLSFVEKEFGVMSKETLYGSSFYNAPDKDNQFIAGYIRPVYFKYTLKNHHELVFQFYDEESETENFEKSWMYNFYSLSVYFVQGDGWSWVKQCIDLVKPFMLAHSFYDATLSYTFDSCLYNHFKTKHDEEAQQYIVTATAEEIKNTFATTSHSYIEIQHKPYLNINGLLAAYPNKEKIISIQINNNNLKTWPDALFEFSNVRTLSIYNNQIEKADIRFSLLKKLEEININENPFVRNPEELAQLKAALPEKCRVVFY